MMSRLALGALVLALFAGFAGADIIHLRNGGKVEGVILSEEDGVLKVKTPFGVIPVKRSDVLRIEEKKTPLEEYEERLRALAPDDAEGHYQLALFCREEKLRKQEKELYALALRIDDQHPGANEAVGNVLFEGRWMTPEERERRVAANEEAAMRARGLVKYKGEWVTPEEKEKLESGLVRHDGKWMTPDDVKRAQGLVPYKGEWIEKDELERRKLVDLYSEVFQLEVGACLSDHFVVVGPYDEGQLQTLCDSAEQALEQFRTILGVDPSESLFTGSEEDDGRSRCHVVYTKKQLDYTRMVDYMCERYPKDVPPSRANLMKQQKGFYFVYPSCYVAGYQFPNTFEQVRASIVHKVSHVLLNRYRYCGNWWPWWLIEGLGTYQEIAILGSCDTYCITEQGYAVAGGDAKNKWAGLARWKEIVKAQVVGLGDTDLISLSRKGLNELDFRDLAKCWSLCEWLIGHDRERFVGLIDRLKDKAAIIEAVKGAFGKSPEQLDKEWRDYVRANY